MHITNFKRPRHRGPRGCRVSESTSRWVRDDSRLFCCERVSGECASARTAHRSAGLACEEEPSADDALRVVQLEDRPLLAQPLRADGEVAPEAEQVRRAGEGEGGDEGGAHLTHPDGPMQ